MLLFFDPPCIYIDCYEWALNASILSRFHLAVTSFLNGSFTLHHLKLIGHNLHNAPWLGSRVIFTPFLLEPLPLQVITMVFKKWWRYDETACFCIFASHIRECRTVSCTYFGGYPNIGVRSQQGEYSMSRYFFLLSIGRPLDSFFFHKKWK